MLIDDEINARTTEQGKKRVAKAKRLRNGRRIKKNYLNQFHARCYYCYARAYVCVCVYVCVVVIYRGRDGYRIESVEAAARYIPGFRPPSPPPPPRPNKIRLRRRIYDDSCERFDTVVLATGRVSGIQRQTSFDDGCPSNGRSETVFGHWLTF